jgi:hypothetical protein
MAVIDTKNKTRNLTSDAAESSSSSDNEKGKVVDIFSEKGLPTGKKVKLDATEDAWTYSAPPPAGPFDIKLFLAASPVTLKEREPGDSDTSYYSIALEGKIVSEDKSINNMTVFPYVNTIIGRGKNISTAAGLIVKLGYKLPGDGEADDYTIAKVLCMAIKKEPIVKVELEWQGYSKTDKKVVYPNMASFPVDENGNHVHIVEYKCKDKSVEEIRAQLKVDHWYGKGEKPEEKPVKSSVGASGGTGKGSVTQMPLLMNDDAREVVQASGSGKNGITDEDLLLEDA